jgi:myosin-6
MLIAVNPYKTLAPLYNESTMRAVKLAASVEMPPHVYALVERAYRKAVRARESGVPHAAQAGPNPPRRMRT